MKPRVAYLISSHFSYAPFALPALLPSLLASGVPAADIFVVMNGCRREFDMATTQGNFWFVEHESRNFSVFVEAVATRRQIALWNYTHVWQLLDTCKVGPRFHAAATDFAGDLDAIGARRLIHDRCVSDLAAYRLTYLLKNKAAMESLKNCTPESNLAYEGKVFANAPRRAFYGGRDGVGEILDSPRDVYGTGSLRLTEYYPVLDLYKFKSNWGQSTRLLESV